MARHFRRLIKWILACIAALAVLALLGIAALWWWIDPDDYRQQIEARASSAIGRPVHLTGRLRWQLGRRIAIVSEGGHVANATGFGPEPLASWSRIRLGLAARPLLDKRVLIDHVDVEGLQLNLQRNAQGSANWELQLAADDSGAESPVAVRIASAALQDGALRFQDAVTGADWRASSLKISARLPEDLLATDREFRDVALSGRVTGGPLMAAGVAVALQAAALRWSPERLQLPAFRARWADAELGGELNAVLAGPEVAASIDMKAPSLRELLATVKVTPPPMRDATTLGALQLQVKLQYRAGAASLDDLSARIDGSQLTGNASLPSLAPLALRFNLAADRIDLDRYRPPADVKGKPIELPLEWLRQLDARGTLRIRQASVAGAAAKEVIIDVE